MKPPKVEDGGDEENEETTSVIISNEEQINCFDKSPTRQSQQNLVKKNLRLHNDIKPPNHQF